MRERNCSVAESGGVQICSPPGIVTSEADTRALDLCQEYQAVLVVGGYLDNKAAWLISFNASYPSCPATVPDYPVPINQAQSAVINGDPITCGSGTDCYKYDIVNNQWTLFATMSTSRATAVVAQISDTEFWIMGSLSPICKSLTCQ